MLADVLPEGQRRSVFASLLRAVDVGGIFGFVAGDRLSIELRFRRAVLLAGRGTLWLGCLAHLGIPSSRTDPRLQAPDDPDDDRRTGSWSTSIGLL